VLVVRRLSLLHAFAAELLRHNEISRATFEQAIELFGNQQLVEIVGVIDDPGAPFASTTQD
jgi:hypothetical protein